jgi:hypothetical protein
MEESMRDSMLMIRKKAMATITGVMEGSSKGGGTKISSME